MKSNTAIIREIIQYLRSLAADKFDSREQRRTICYEIEKMGAVYIGEGCYSFVYAVDKFVIKISSDELEKLRAARRNKVFRRFAPPVYWIHPSGSA